MGKSQHMAGVMNLRSLKFCFSQRLLSWEISGSFLPSCQLGISLAQLVSCEGLDCGLRSSRRPQGSELGTVCVGGGWGQGAEPRWRACYCLEVPFSILTCAWHLSPTVLIRGSWPSAFLLSAVPQFSQCISPVSEKQLSLKSYWAHKSDFSRVYFLFHFSFLQRFCVTWRHHLWVLRKLVPSSFQWCCFE